MKPVVISLNIVHAEIPDVGGSVGITAIDKRPVVKSCTVTDAGIEGDKRSDMLHHGSPNQAVYAYSIEDYKWWEEQLGRELKPGQFGENLTTSGIDLNNLVLGTKVKVGSAILQSTGPRIPCGTFARWMNEDKWVKRFTDSNRIGSYFKVIQNGQVSSDDDFEIFDVPSHGTTVLDYFKVHTGDRDQKRIINLVNCPDLEEDKRNKYREFLSS